MVEVKSELGEVRVQALPSNRPGSLLVSTGCQRCRGHALPFHVRHSLQSKDKLGGIWLNLSSGSSRHLGGKGQSKMKFAERAS